MIIGIDIDDTIADTNEMLFNYAQEYTINVLKKEPVLREGTCDTHKYVQFFHSWKDGDDIQFFNDYYEKVILNIKPKTLAVEYIQKLHNDGHKIILITARWDTDRFDVRKATQEWVKKNNIPYDKLIINAENKLIAAKQENVDLFIDDSFSNCQMVSKGGIRTFLIDTRYNAGLKDENIERVFSWPHIYMKIGEEK